MLPSPPTQMAASSPTLKVSFSVIWPRVNSPFSDLVLGGATIWAKREDCNSGLAFGGNKVRKLEYLLADALAQGIPGAKQVVIPKCGHGVAREQPEALASAVIAFLAELAQ